MTRYLNSAKVGHSQGGMFVWSGVMVVRVGGLCLGRIPVNFEPSWAHKKKMAILGLYWLHASIPLGGGISKVTTLSSLQNTQLEEVCM